MEVYYEQDADLGLFRDQAVAVIGYGSQGHAQAQNLRDSGVTVYVGQRPGGANHDRAVEHGFEPVSAAEATQKASFIQVLVPDQIQPDLYAKEIEPYLGPEKTLVFSHGFNIHYNQIVPPADVDVIMVAPKAPGHLVRWEYEREAGVPALVAVYQDASGRALEKGLAYAKGLGCTRAGVLRTTFAEETETDLFGEQAVLCRGVTELVKNGYETLVEAGYQPEIAYFECLHELKLIVDLFYQGGFEMMRNSVSDTAEFGDYTRGSRVVDEEVKENMAQVLEEVQNGTFAKEWILENKAGQPSFRAMRNRARQHDIVDVGQKLRNMMPWLKR
jgi:ketol-acid reductoisomerase